MEQRSPKYMTAKQFAESLNAVSFQAFPRKIEFTTAELTAAGIQASDQVATTLNALIKTKNKSATLHFQAEDMTARSFLNRAALGIGEDGRAAYGWQRGKDLTPQK